jgi:murein DD-endopeptidase MepM/ murein hydrolase activator NlpD
MQPVRLKNRGGAGPGARDVPQAGEKPARKPRRRTLSRLGRTSLLLLAFIGFGWGGAATWLLMHEKAVVATLREEQQFIQASYEERVRALTRRLVSSIATKRAPEPGREGTDDHLADLITRQVELETRQNLLGALTGQAVAPVLPGGGAQAPGGATGFAAHDGPANILDRLAPAMMAPQRRQIGALLRAEEPLPLAERIPILRQSLDRVDLEQGRQVSALGARLVARVQDVRTALAELGLDVARVKLPAVRPAVGGPLIPVSVATRPGSFEHGLMQLNQAQSLYGRWRDLANIVPLRRPLDGDDSTTSNFGMRTDPFTGAPTMHAGMDFRAETGTPVRSTGAGKVLRAEVSGGYGNLVEIDHGNGLTTRYAHLSAFDVKPDQIVPPGALIGRIGSTGRSTGPHLHYETRLDGEASNPLRFIEAGMRLSQPAMAASIR